MSVKRSTLVAIATLFMVVAAPAAYAQVGYGYGQAGYGYGQAGYGYGQAGYGYGQAGCGGCGTAYAPIVYAQPIAPAQIYVGGCNTCAEPVTPVAAPAACCAMPVAPAPCCAMPAPAPIVSGCGGCGMSLPILSALTGGGGCGGCGAPAPVVSAWGGGCGGCGAPAACCGTPAVYTTPAPVYVVNQGPDYTGPGIMEPYRTYAPPAQYAPPPAYPPYAGYGPRPYYPVHHYYPNVAYHPHAWAPRYYERRPYWRG
jgi:hypothetical protein